MANKTRNTSLKHLDFLLLDILSLGLSFFIAYYLRFHTLTLSNAETWLRLLLIMILLDIVITLLLTPYNGIFKRLYYEQIFSSVQLTFFIMLSTAVFFYLFKMGSNYSRLMFFYTFILYFFISVIVKYIWKKLIVHRKRERIPLFVITPEADAELTIRGVYSGDFHIYEIAGIFLTDSMNTQERTHRKYSEK